MKERARVVSEDGGFAKVTLKRASACGDNCAQCKGGCAPGSTFVEAENTIGAHKGQEVILEMKTGLFLGAVGITYVLPLIMLTAGIIIGTSVKAPFGLKISKDLFGLILGFALMAISYLIGSLVDKRFKKSGKILFRITKIIE